jgi:predicted ABC-type ATPase
MKVPALWLVAGPNGAGKTTAVQRDPISGLLPGVTFLNPDDRTLAKLQQKGFQGFKDAPVALQSRLFAESADEVLSEVNCKISDAEPIGVETVLSSKKYCTAVEAVLRGAGVVGLIYVALSSPEIAKQRVATRVRAGGHGVPDDRIEPRWRRSLDLLPWFAMRSTYFWIVDNSLSDPTATLRLLATGLAGRLDYVSTDVFPEMQAALTQIPT